MTIARSGFPCRGQHCRATITWALTSTGARIPLEEVTIYEFGPDLETARVVARRGFISHFLTCPDRSWFSHTGTAPRKPEPPRGAAE